MPKQYFIKKILLFFIVLLSGCASNIPQKAKGIENACDILHTDKSWEKAFRQTEKKYNVQPNIIMAFIYQESRFKHDAKPPRKTFLGVPALTSPDVYGFAQALDTTWDWYKKATKNNNAERDNFPDTVDFIGWYIETNTNRTGTAKSDAKNQYFAYHDGSGGFLKGSHLKKDWLIKVANKVANNSSKYRNQLQNCYY